MKTRRRVSAKDEEHEEGHDRRLSPRKRRKVEYNTEEDSHVDNGSELEEEDKQSNGEDGQYGLFVTCGNKRGTLHVEKLKLGVDCIDCEGHMFSPNSFENYGGKGTTKKWKSTIFYNHKPLQFWIDRGHLSSPRFKRRQSAGSKWSDHIKSHHKGSDAENGHKDKLNPEEKPEKMNKELVTVQNGEESLTITGIRTTMLQKKPKLVLKKLPEESEVQHAEKEMHTEDTLSDADKTSEAQDNSEDTEDTEDTEADARSLKDNQNENAEFEAETVPSPTHVQSPVEDVSPDVTDPDPAQQMPMERPPQSHSPSPIKDTPASTLLSSSELDKMAFEQLKSHEEDEHNSSWSVPKEAEQQHVKEDTHVEDTITDADKTSEAQDNSEETEDKEADASSLKDHQNENAECAAETVPSPTHVQSTVEDVSPGVTNSDPAQQMPMERPPQSHSPSPIKNTPASTPPSSSELDKIDIEQESNEEDEHDMSAGESDHKEKQTQNEQPPETKEEKVDVQIGERTNAIITDIKRTMLKKKPKLVLKKLPRHILDRSHLKSTNTLVNGKTKTEVVQNLEKDKNHDNAESEVQNAASPTHVQSPIEDTSPDLTNPDPVQQNLIERPPQSHSPSPIKDALVQTPLTNTELDTMDLEQLKREKIKLQLKVLKLQEEYYTLQLKKLKE